MEQLIINGGKKLGGELKVCGAKNSALPVLASTILVNGECVIHNCPNISDIKETLKILKDIGCRVSVDGSTVTVNSKDVCISSIDEATMRRMRSSIIFLGALVSRLGTAELYHPGGCEIGARPIDLHISSLRALNVNVLENGSSIKCCCSRPCGAKIILPFPSVGATENIIICAVKAKGKTTIINAAREPEISDLADFLNHCGARIYGAGEGTIEIEGVKELNATEHTIIPDRIIASTYMSACAITGSQLTVKAIKSTHLSPIFPVFSEMGCELYLSGNDLKISAPRRLKRVRNIKTLPYPGFPTDSQPMVTAALATARGTSIVSENIFENRFRYVSELNRLGTDIELNGKLAIINGVKELHSGRVNATDLRGGAALVVAALKAQGETQITNTHFIDRGYECIEKELSSIGADIKRISNEETKKRNI